MLSFQFGNRLFINDYSQLKDLRNGNAVDHAAKIGNEANHGKKGSVPGKKLYLF